MNVRVTSLERSFDFERAVSPSGPTCFVQRGPAGLIWMQVPSAHPESATPAQVTMTRLMSKLLT